MATILAINDGNWNEPSIWDSGTVPTIDDVVYLNGHTVTANVNIDLGTNGEIRNDEEQGVGAVAGGTIANSTVGRTIIANSYCGSTYLYYVSASGNTATNYSLVVTGDVHCITGIAFAKNNSRYPNFVINGDVFAEGGALANGSTTEGWLTVNGNIYITAIPTSNYIVANFVNALTVVGDIQCDVNIVVFNNVRGVNITGDISGVGQLTSGTNGNITLGGNTSIRLVAGSAITTLTIENCNQSILSGGAITTLHINGNITGGSSALCTTITTMNVNGGNIALNSGALASSYITTLNLNGTLTQGQGQIASYITTLNLDGTLNLSGTRPFTYGVQNLNVATGGIVTYDNHLYYCFTNIVAVDSNFTITCRNQNLDNFDFKNKNLLNNTYPAQANVSDGYVYGLEDQFTGSYSLPPESVVLEGTPYGSHVGTLTLDISSGVQDTIDDIEDEVNILVDSYPPLVTLENITNIGNTSATINLSVSNTALITKTGAEVDIDWNFSNPYEYEVNNWVTSVNVTGLNPSVQYYVRGYVIYDGTRVYSKNATTLQTLLLPPQLQLCEYLQTDGNAYIQTDVVGSDINTCECKCYSTSNNAFIFYCHYNNTTNAFDLLINNTSPYKYTTRIFRSNADVSNVVKGNLLTFKFNRYHNRVQFNDQVINYTHSLGSNTGRVVLFTTSGNNSGTQMYYWTSNVAKFYSCYVKTGETYEDNKGNTCSAGTAGMCDILTGTFYTNDGSGGFTHGNDM